MKRIFIITLLSLFVAVTAFAGNDLIMPMADPLEAFSASRQIDRNMLTWVTGATATNNHYEVERSTDGKTWKTIAVVLETFESGKVKKYSFNDEHNDNEIIHYRIRLVDIKGKSSYSSVRTVRRNLKLYRIAGLAKPASAICAVRVSKAAGWIG